MVLRAQWPLGTIAQFFHFVAEEKKKKKDDKKTKAFYDWATTGIPVKMIKYLNANSQPNIWLSMITRALSFLRKFQL